MTLQKATSLLIAGLLYTVLHTVMYGLLPGIGWSTAGMTVGAVLWIAITFAIVLFAFQWLKELGGTGRVHDWRLSRRICDDAQCTV